MIYSRNLIQGTNASNVIYISNKDYFAVSDPMHGANVQGTCGSVAAQLLLSYNNFYNNRRILAPYLLNGGWNNATGNNNINDPANYTNPAQYPNVCADPMNMTHYTTGSNHRDLPVHRNRNMADANGAGRHLCR